MSDENSTSPAVARVSLLVETNGAMNPTAAAEAALTELRAPELARRPIVTVEWGTDYFTIDLQAAHEAKPAEQREAEAKAWRRQVWSLMGKIGGSSKSEKKTAAVRENAKKARQSLQYIFHSSGFGTDGKHHIYVLRPDGVKIECTRERVARLRVQGRLKERSC